MIMMIRKTNPGTVARKAFLTLESSLLLESASTMIEDELIILKATRILAESSGWDWEKLTSLEYGDENALNLFMLQAKNLHENNMLNVDEENFRKDKYYEDDSFLVQYLSKFSYEDWEIGEDNRLRLGDHLLMTLNEPNWEDRYRAAFIGIDNNFPVLYMPYSLKSKDDCTIIDIHEAELQGQEFCRISPESFLENVEKYNM